LLKRTPVEFKKGDLVLVSSKNIKTVRPKKKLDRKFLGPWAIKEVLSPVAYRLDVPKNRNLHSVFHVSLLERYKTSPSTCWSFIAP